MSKTSMKLGDFPTERSDAPVKLNTAHAAPKASKVKKPELEGTSTGQDSKVKKPELEGVEGEEVIVVDPAGSATPAETKDPKHKETWTTKVVKPGPFYDDSWHWKRPDGGKDPCCWDCSRRFFWYWRHPVNRVFFALLIMVLNFYIYAVDPVCESKRETSIPIAGQFWSIITQDLSKENGTWSLGIGRAMIRILFILIIYIGGALVGWWGFHRWFLKRTLKLHVFGYYSEEEKVELIAEEKGDTIDEFKGSWFATGVFLIFWGYPWVVFYNNVGLPEGYEVQDWLGFNEYLFNKMAVSLSWMGDSFTLFMIIDSMLQERVRYPAKWMEKPRQYWVEGCGGYFRVLLVWFFWVTGTITVVYAVWIRDDSALENWRISQNIISHESERALVASLIFALDLAIVCQDWDFPRFDNDQKILVTGFNVWEISFPPECCTRIFPKFLHNFFSFRINGKWLNYTPMILVMGLDMNAYNALANYEPGEFAQYFDMTSDSRNVWNVQTEDKANELGLLFDESKQYDLLNFTIRAGKCYGTNETACDPVTNPSLDSECQWYKNDFAEIGYCTNGDHKLSAGWYESGSLAWTLFPIGFMVLVLIYAFRFQYKYQIDTFDTQKASTLRATKQLEMQQRAILKEAGKKPEVVRQA